MPAISPALLARLRSAADPGADRDLLRAFLAERSELAFAALVRRHGQMVLGVCRRVLGNPHDADDAFQATFLVLARKANTVGRPDRLPGWLHTIAVRTATEVRRMRDRRRKLEQASGGRQPPVGGDQGGADAPRSPEQSELAALLDEELANLPDHYRVPVVLCELQGLPRKEAAARLKLPEGTLSSRLAKARKLLADRLARRGVTASTAAIAAVLAREASARVSADAVVEAARAALTAAASAAAVHAADGVVKALLVTKLKGLALAVGVIVACAGGVTTLSGGAGPSAATKSDPDPAKLVKQLGSPNFAEREQAEKKLKEVGPRAKTSVLAGTKDPDPEVARRSAVVLDHIRTAGRTAFSKQFREAKEGPLAIDYPVWDRFRRITGDTKEARALFAAVIADDARFRRLADAEANPADAARSYAVQSPGWRPPQGRRIPAGLPPLPGMPKEGVVLERPESIDPADLAAWLILGTYPGTSAKLPDRREERLADRKGFVEALTGPHAAPLRKLYPAWLAARTDADVIGSGLETARACNLAECLPLARKLAADPKVGIRNRAGALLVVGQFGGPKDVALARPLLTETSRYGTFLIGDPSRAQVKDIAAAAMLMVHDQKPWEFGFKCAFPHSRFGARDANVYGFPSEEARASGHKAVLAYIEAAEKRTAAKPESAVPAGKPADLKQFLADFRADKAGVNDFDHPLWKRFTAAAGKDKAARVLFAELVADPDRADRLAKAATDPASAGELYVAEKGEVLKVYNAFYAAHRERTKEVRDEAQKHKLLTQAVREAEKAPPVGAVGALLVLGTFPETTDVTLDVPGPDRLPLDTVPLALAVHGKDAFPWSPAARRLFVAWLADRNATEDQMLGLQKAAAGFGLREALPLARRWAANPLKPPRVRGMALVIIGRFGTAAAGSAPRPTDRWPTPCTTTAPPSAARSR